MTGAAIVARVAAALAGNYAATAASGALLAVLLARAGMARADAVVAASIVAIAGFLVMLIWAFHAPIWRAWFVLAGIATAAAMLVHLLGPETA